MRSVMTKHMETSMGTTIAASTKSMFASGADTFWRRLDRLRFAIGIAISLGGAGAVLSHLISLAPSLG